MRRRSWQTFAGLFRGSGPLLALSFAASLLQSLLLVPVALLVKNVFDDLVPHGRAEALAWNGAAILGLYLASAAAGLFTRYMVLKPTKKAITRLRSELLERVYGFPRAYFDRASLGQLQSTIVQDSERLDTMANLLVGELVPSLIVAIGLSAVLIVLNPLLFLVLVAVVPVLILVGKWLGRRVSVSTRAWYRAFDTFSTQTQLALRAMTLTKVQAAEQIELQRRRWQFAELAEAGRRMSWLQTAYGIVQQSVAASAGVVVLVIGGAAVANKQMTIGELLSFYAVVALLLRQVNAILALAPHVISGYESMTRLNDILDADEPEPYPGTRTIDFRGALELEHVGFSYGDEPLLEGVDLRVAPGERVAIVGPNGAGKSTLVSLILGLYRPQVGRVLADGVPFDELDLRALRGSIGVVLQDPIIFPGTIRENIGYGRPEAGQREVLRAAEWATAHDFIKDLPHGYETEVGDEGVLLSGGQRQRIAIARALVSRPAVLLLDEPTTYLDDASIRILMHNLRDFPGGPSLVMVSHDMEVAREADCVYHLRDGRIAGIERPGDRDLAPAVPLPLRGREPSS
jgi:ABC-type bacteriocin/lantibiotic exporter with double-glycine peptidase domain